MANTKDDMLIVMQKTVELLENSMKDKDLVILDLKSTITSMEKTIAELRNTISTLNGNIEGQQQTIANLEETIRELQRRFLGTSSEKSKPEEKKTEEDTNAEKKNITVKGHTRTSRKKSSREELYEKVPIRRVNIDMPDAMRICTECNAELISLGYKYVREELHIIPAQVERIHYYKEMMKCPVCDEDEITSIYTAPVPKPLLVHSPASPSIVAYVIYQKFVLALPYYRQEGDWMQHGVPLPRETTANWCIKCTLNYLKPVYDRLHEHLLERQFLHCDEVPCQVLHEKGRSPQAKSYFWIYMSGTDGLPPIVLYEYQPGRKGEYPKAFLDGFSGFVHCDGYSAYNKLESVILVCCLAHVRRKFFEAIPPERRKKLKLLDVNSQEEISITEEISVLKEKKKLPAEICFAYCNKLFLLERNYKGMDPEKRAQLRKTEALPVWNEFFIYLNSFETAGGSKIQKAVNYAKNHKDKLLNYLLDGRCEISNNAAERKAKSYVIGRKNFLFHNSEDGARSSAVLYSLIETAKSNNLNIFQYIYTLLLYMPDHINSPEGIEALMPWSDFIKERCSGLMDTETITPVNRESLPI